MSFLKFTKSVLERDDYFYVGIELKITTLEQSIK